MSSSQSQRDDICYHHFALTFPLSELANRFQDVRFVLVAGCEHRAAAMATYLHEQLLVPAATADAKLERQLLTGPRSRFTLFKVGSVLISNHGMGPASMSIALHELLLMCQQAAVIKLITLIRFGTCGGIGVQPGTLCVTTRALDSLFQDFVEYKICAKLVTRLATIDQVTANKILQLAKSSQPPVELGKFEIRSGATVSTNDFYEEQGRTNGAICEHSQADKMEFLEKARSLGVINMEMESTYLAAMCHKLGVAFAVVCVALNNRLNNDHVTVTHDEWQTFEKRLFWLIERFISDKIATATT